MVGEEGTGLGALPTARAGGPTDLSHSTVSQPEALIPNAVYLEVQADVRYWEDAFVNGEPDNDGLLIPFRERDMWHPWIDLKDGRIGDWPHGTEADIHYKVCDAGEYWLTDREGRRLAKWRGCYVPSAFLCHGGSGYGDYIILKVDKHGFIADWMAPEIKEEDWKPIASAIPTGTAETAQTGSVHG